MNTHPLSLAYFASKLGFEIAPALRTIYEAAEGTTAPIANDLCRRMFGLPTDDVRRAGEEGAPRIMYIRTGAMCGKTSRLAAVKALHAALYGPFDGAVGMVVVRTTQTKIRQMADWLKLYLTALKLPSEMSDVANVETLCRVDRPDGRSVTLAVTTHDNDIVKHYPRNALVALVVDDAEVITDANSWLTSRMIGLDGVQLKRQGQMWIIGSPVPGKTSVFDQKVDKYWGTLAPHHFVITVPSSFLWTKPDMMERLIRAKMPAWARCNLDGETTMETDEDGGEEEELLEGDVVYLNGHKRPMVVTGLVDNDKVDLSWLCDDGSFEAVTFPVKAVTRTPGGTW